MRCARAGLSMVSAGHNLMGWTGLCMVWAGSVLIWGRVGVGMVLSGDGLGVSLAGRELVWPWAFLGTRLE
jgi:hypothetical protein